MTTVATPPRRITEELLRDVPGRHGACVVATEPGIVAGLHLLDPAAAGVPVGDWEICQAEGGAVEPGAPIVRITGSAVDIGNAEDFVLGPLGFAGGVARRAKEIRDMCPPGLRVACGGWKKLPAAMKPALRAGLAVAGVRPRLVDGAFVYIPKNTVILHGALGSAVRAGLRLGHGPVAVQVTDVAGARVAVEAGARIIMVDTGTLDALAEVDTALRQDGLRDQITIGFGGGVTADCLTAARRAGADVVDMGRAVLDAPLWDVRVEVHP